MKINLIYIPIFYRTPYWTFVNAQSQPKCYSKPLHIGLLDYIYPRIARAKFHLKRPRKSVVFLTCQLITTDETLTSLPIPPLSYLEQMSAFFIDTFRRWFYGDSTMH